MTNSSFIRRAATVSIAVAAIMGLTGCSQITSLFGGGATRDEDGQVTEAGENSVFEIQVGDCMGASTGSEVSSVEAVPCTDAHDDEVFFLFDMPEGDFPGGDAIDEASSTQCEEAFVAYVGVDSATSTYEWATYVPTTETWENGDREVVCLAYAEDGSQTTGSIKGSNK